MDRLNVAIVGCGPAGFAAGLLLAPLSRHWPAWGIQAQLMSGLFGFPLGLVPPDYEGLAASASRISFAASGLPQS